jgi:hypothetical protein
MRVTIPRSVDDAKRWKLLQDSFEAVFMVKGGPWDAAMYSARDMVATDLAFYFSPGATRIFRTGIDLHHGKPSSRPDKDHVSLLVGHADAVDPESL